MGSEEDRTIVLKQLLPFIESTYLHQVIEQGKDNLLRHYDDLHIALNNIYNQNAKEWRIHFHVPVFMKQFAELLTTQNDIIEVFELLKNEIITTHLEIETNTWEVLPPEIKIEMASSIVMEMEWVIRRLESVVLEGNVK